MLDDLMLDLETLGTQANALIVQIGAAYFDRRSGTVGGTFRCNVSIRDSLKYGMTVSDGALKFWFDHPGRTWLKGTYELTKALDLFAKFCNKKARVWSHANFDVPILSQAYYLIGRKPPFSYKNCRDIRTLVDLAALPKETHQKTDKSHDALEDCLYQIKYCLPCLWALGGK